MVRKLIDEDIAERGIPFERISKKDRIEDIQELDKEFRKSIRR